MHPYEIAAVCRALVFVVGLVLVGARSWRARRLDWRAAAVLALGFVIAVGSSVGIDRNLLAVVTLPYAGGVVLLADAHRD